ncbi:hypothetical protein [Streptomyces sp. NPDC051109]
MDEMQLPHSGWRNGEVPVTHAPDGAATVAETKGGVLGGFYV